MMTDERNMGAGVVNEPSSLRSAAVDSNSPIVSRNMLSMNCSASTRVASTRPPGCGPGTLPTGRV